MSDLKSETFRVIAVDFQWARDVAPADVEYVAHAEQYEHWRDGIVWRARLIMPGRTETGEGCSAHEAVQRAAIVCRVRELLRAGEPTRAELAAMVAGERVRIASLLRDRADDAVNDAPEYAEALYDAESIVRGERPVYAPSRNAATTEPAAGQAPIVSVANVE